jgi:hypothetical protein
MEARRPPNQARPATTPRLAAPRLQSDRHFGSKSVRIVLELEIPQPVDVPTSSGEHFVLRRITKIAMSTVPQGRPRQ